MRIDPLRWVGPSRAFDWIIPDLLVPIVGTDITFAYRQTGEIARIADHHGDELLSKAAFVYDRDILDAIHIKSECPPSAPGVPDGKQFSHVKLHWSSGRLDSLTSELFIVEEGGKVKHRVMNRAINYDAQGRVAGVSTNGNRDVSIAYDLSGRVRSEKMGNVVYEYHYSSEGELWGIRQTLGDHVIEEHFLEYARGKIVRGYSYRPDEGFGPCAIYSYRGRPRQLRVDRIHRYCYDDSGRLLVDAYGIGDAEPGMRIVRLHDTVAETRLSGISCDSYTPHEMISIAVYRDQCWLHQTAVSDQQGRIVSIKNSREADFQGILPVHLLALEHWMPRFF